jgi:tetrahydromethanopterin S-methyltransferase subunit E
MTKLLQNLKEKLSYKAAPFWGPVGIAVGIICIINSFNTTATSFFNFESDYGIINIVIGIVVLIIGIILSVINRDKTIIARVGLTTGLSIFFWGISIVNIDDANCNILLPINR